MQSLIFSRWIRYVFICILPSIFIIIFGCGSNPVKETQIIEVDKTDSILLSIDADTKAKQLEWYFDSLHKLDYYNGNVLIAQHGVPVFKKSYGLANKKRKDTLSIENSFQLASVSKQFTAVAILLLAHENKCSLSDTVQKYFPDFPYHNITIHLLLSHRSGLPNYIYLFDKILEDKTRCITNREVVDTLISQHPQWYYPPDKRFDYSNTGYVVLAAIVEKISGVSFQEFLRKRIFLPLQMNNTSIGPDPIDSSAIFRAQGYNYPWRSEEDNFSDGVLGDKGIWSTVEDMLKWDKALSNGVLLPVEDLAIAFEPWSKEKKGNKNYGYGWRLEFLADSTKMIYHTGWWHGFQNFVIRMPQDETSVILLRNRKTRHRINQYDIFDILYPGNNFRPEEISDSTSTDSN